ncbi:DNA recombination protein RmuC [Cytophagaceae bacterium ABcell3]|nr:DNA recombination protein RmuC [Cytophagaceae bacterium ABcell3]
MTTQLQCVAIDYLAVTINSFIMMTILLVLLLILALVNLFLLYKTQFSTSGGEHSKGIEQYLERIERNLKDDFRIQREESSHIAKANRDELTEALKESRRETWDALKSIHAQNQQTLEKLNLTLENKITALLDKADVNERANRELLERCLKEFGNNNIVQLDKVKGEVSQNLRELTEQNKKDNSQFRDTLIMSIKDFQQSFNKSVQAFNEVQKEKFAQLAIQQEKLVEGTEKKLEEMRVTVDEKLQKTLHERLGQSFSLVSKQLENVQKGLGEMQSLAQDVGGLKKVLSNVKTRGTLGEIQLGNILEQIMSPGQFDCNVKTKKGSGDMVEFAIKLPGRDEGQGSVYLPLDSKFPTEAYHKLQTAYETADAALIDAAGKVLEASIKKCAKDISEKYIDPPYTTDFAIMFLPVEGLYAEVVRRTNLLEQLQRNYKIIITGPTTLAALLNSLQLGFRTLAIQKRSSEVWEILGGVKTEFAKFAGMLEKAKKNIDTASGQIEDVLGVRTRAIQKRLNNVQQLPDNTKGL